ncbi:MAG: APC family permease [Acidimicrobiia bacterium]|nr:APC family permease [Acidimicrobiia bacterium]MDH4307581.1 APC family permease [Acidimicrobiia bacterium]MDH5294670.1 APC family permease [Acidimicrobiia bacterium]
MAKVDIEKSESLVKALGTWDIFAAGVGLVVAASTLVSDFQGWFGGGTNFAIALVASGVLNLLLGLSAAELSTTYPKAGALYDYGAAATPGGHGAKTIVGVFLALLFYFMFAFAGGGETTAGASGAVGLFDAGSVQFWIIVMTVLAVIPNLMGIEALAKLELGLLVGMLGIRWFFGLAGFAGFSDLGSWSTSNIPTAIEDFAGFAGIVALTGGFAFWSFVGIEFVAPLAEETKDPARSIPKGIVFGILAILATSLFMGYGVSGLGQDWAGTVSADAPQLDVGIAMFGTTGRVLMALASVLATFASMTIVYAAMPRILYGISRNGHFLGPLSRWFGHIHPKYRTPWVAIIVTAVFYTSVALYYTSAAEDAVITQIFTAAYVWILIYAIYHVLVLVSRFTNPDVDRPFKLPLAVPAVGLVMTLYVWYKAFEGAHGDFGSSAVKWILIPSVVITIVSYVIRDSANIVDHLEEEVHQEI